MKKYPLFFIIVFYIILIGKFSSYVPIWDAWRNTDIWIRQAVFSPFNLFNFDSGGHPSFSYFLPLGLLQYIDFGNMIFLHGTTTVMGTIAILFFYKLLKLIFPETKNIEIYLLTAIFAFYPIFLASQLHINPDFGVLVYFVVFLYLYLRQKRIASLTAALFLVFAKESGIMVYAATLICFSSVSLITDRLSHTKIIQNIKRNFIYLLPFVLFVFRLLYRVYALKTDALWFAFNTSSRPLDFVTFSPDILSRVPLSYFLGIFVINFNWIMTIFIVVGFFAVVFGRTHRVIVGERKLLVMVYLIFTLSLIFLTLFKTFTNVRYFLTLYAMMIMLSYVGLKALIVSRRLRVGVLLFVFLIFLSSNFLTLDPVSKKIWGTFRFGRHEMLKMTSITGECCGWGRDQLAYNLQFTYFHKLLDKFYTAVRIGSSDPIAHHPIDSPEIIGRVDKKNFQRTLRIRESYEPYLVTYIYPSLIPKPDQIYYLEFPNVDNKETLRYYLTYYTIEEVKSYEQDGYSMNVYLLRARSSR